MTARRCVLWAGLLSACGGGSGGSDAGAADVSGRPGSSRVADAASIAGDAASSSGDAAPSESEFLPMARRACAEICRCDPPDEWGWCSVLYSECTHTYSITPELCILGFVNRMEALKRLCPGSVDPCNCQWLEECRHWALTVVCDPRRGLLVEHPWRCLWVVEHSSDDPTCDLDPLRPCDAGVR